MLFLSENTQETPVRHEMDILTETVNIVHDMMNLNESHIKYEYQSLTTLNEDVDSKLKKVKDFILSIIEKVKTALKRVTDYIKNLIARFTKAKKAKPSDTNDSTNGTGSESKPDSNHAVVYYNLSSQLFEAIKEVRGCANDLNRTIDKVLRSPLNPKTSTYVVQFEEDISSVKDIVDNLKNHGTKSYTESELQSALKMLSELEKPINAAVKQLDEVKNQLNKTNDMRQVMDLQATIKIVNTCAVMAGSLCSYLGSAMNPDDAYM